MNCLLRPRIWPSFLASSGVGPCDVPFRYASEPIPRDRGTVARWQAHFRGLATAIHEISGQGLRFLKLREYYLLQYFWIVGNGIVSECYSSASVCEKVQWRF
jgi:hypothetical protein